MKFRQASKRKKTSEVNLTPLVDIVFILLIFFMITSTFVQNPGFEVDLPKAKNAPPTSEAANIIVTLTHAGQLIYEGEVLAADELKNKLQNIRDQSSSQTIVIQADEATPHGSVVEAMDTARDAGYERLAIATEPN